MSKLKQLLEKANAKANDCAEAKLLAAFIEDILDDHDDHDDDPALVAASMDTLIEWARDFKLAAEQSA